MASAHADSRSPTIVRPRARRDFAPWADPAAKPLLRFETISKNFGGVTAVDQLSLDIYQGEFFALLGPSGCGKSTLLRLLAGFETPDEGRVLLDGVDVTRVPPHRRPVNMMFQNYALFPHLTVEGNVAFGLEQERLPKAEIAARVAEMLALVKLEGLVRRKPHQLSGGQRQRVAVGRALIRKPQAFLLDEPLSNLDASLRERVRHDFRELFRKIGATVIYVTHDQVEAMTLADRVAVLDRGRLQQLGTPEDVYHRPANRFVASFIGSPSMNFFETDLEDGIFRLGGISYDTGVRRSCRVTIGMRPEAIQAGPGMKGRVCWSETLGAQFLVAVKIEETILTTLVRSRPAAETIDLGIDPNEIHVFDNDSGKNLRSHSPDGSAHVAAAAGHLRAARAQRGVPGVLGRAGCPGHQPRGQTHPQPRGGRAGTDL